MVASIAASAFFHTTSSLSPGSAKSTKTISEVPESLNFHEIGAKPAPSLQVKANAQAVPKINGSKVGLRSDVGKTEEDGASSASRTFYNQLPDWSMLLAAITTIFLAAEKQWTLIDWKPRRPDMLADAFGFGKFVQDGLAFRQNFSIRSYEVGADRTASIETLMNHLQETALNHVRIAGLMDDGFGATPEMSKRNLIWVIAKMHVSVEKYPSWADVVQVDTWVGSSGKNGVRRDWQVIDCQTGQTIVRATGISVLMNKSTRKLSKMPDEVRAEIGPYLIGTTVVVDEDGRKLPKLTDGTAQYVRKGLTPRWGDLYVNQHVNNVKYVGWILESSPSSMMESHELAGMTVEYRRECGRNNVLQSLTSVSADGSTDAEMECVHLLQLESGEEIARGRTKWRPKRPQGFSNQGPLPSRAA